MITNGVSLTDMLIFTVNAIYAPCGLFIVIGKGTHTERRYAFQVAKLGLARRSYLL